VFVEINATPYTTPNRLYTADSLYHGMDFIQRRPFSTSEGSQDKSACTKASWSGSESSFMIKSPEAMTSPIAHESRLRDVDESSLMNVFPCTIGQPRVFEVRAETMMDVSADFDVIQYDLATDSIDCQVSQI